MPLHLLLIVNYIVVICSDNKIRWISCSNRTVTHSQGVSKNADDGLVGITAVPSYEFAIVCTEGGCMYQVPLNIDLDDETKDKDITLLARIPQLPSKTDILALG